MSYKSWHEEHSLKHKKIIDKLSHLSDEEIIKYFDYNNMLVNEKEFCVLFKDNKKCHEMEDLNCYLCACPNFRVSEIKSFCSIDSKDGGSIEHNGFTHQDCSSCTVPHSVNYIKNNFNRSWESCMKDTFSKYSL